jgi:hypothetical protein
MRRPNVKTPGRGSGAGVEKNTEAGNLKTHSAAHGPAACQCRSNPSGCFVCRRWDRTIREIDARRADSLRRESMSYLMRTGG